MPVSEVTSCQQLRSATHHQLLLISRYRLITLGRGAYAVPGLMFWNSLADKLWTYFSDRFKAALKTSSSPLTSVFSILEASAVVCYIKWWLTDIESWSLNPRLSSQTLDCISMLIDLFLSFCQYLFQFLFVINYHFFIQQLTNFHLTWQNNWRWEGNESTTSGQWSADIWIVTYNGGLDPLVANDFNFI